MDPFRRRLVLATALFAMTGCSSATSDKKKVTRNRKQRPAVPKNRSRGPQSLEGLMSMDQYVSDLDHAAPQRRIEAAKQLGAVGPSAKSALGKLQKLADDGDAKVAAAAQAAIKKISR